MRNIHIRKIKVKCEDKLTYHIPQFQDPVTLLKIIAFLEALEMIDAFWTRVSLRNVV